MVFFMFAAHQRRVHDSRNVHVPTSSSNPNFIHIHEEDLLGAVLNQHNSLDELHRLNDVTNMAGMHYCLEPLPDLSTTFGKTYDFLADLDKTQDISHGVLGVQHKNSSAVLACSRSHQQVIESNRTVPTGNETETLHYVEHLINAAANGKLGNDIADEILAESANTSPLTDEILVDSANMSPVVDGILLPTNARSLPGRRSATPAKSSPVDDGISTTPANVRASPSIRSVKTVNARPMDDEILADAANVNPIADVMLADSANPSPIAYHILTAQTTTPLSDGLVIKSGNTSYISDGNESTNLNSAMLTTSANISPGNLLSETTDDNTSGEADYFSSVHGQGVGEHDSLSDQELNVETPKEANQSRLGTMDGMCTRSSGKWVTQQKIASDTQAELQVAGAASVHYPIPVQVVENTVLVHDIAHANAASLGEDTCVEEQSAIYSDLHVGSCSHTSPTDSAMIDSVRTYTELQQLTFRPGENENTTYTVVKIVAVPQHSSEIEQAISSIIQPEIVQESSDFSTYETNDIVQNEIEVATRVDENTAGIVAASVSSDSVMDAEGGELSANTSEQFSGITTDISEGIAEQATRICTGVSTGISTGITNGITTSITTAISTDISESVTEHTTEHDDFSMNVTGQTTEIPNDMVEHSPETIHNQVVLENNVSQIVASHEYIAIDEDIGMLVESEVTVVSTSPDQMITVSKAQFPSTTIGVNERLDLNETTSEEKNNKPSGERISESQVEITTIVETVPPISSPQLTPHTNSSSGEQQTSLKPMDRDGPDISSIDGLFATADGQTSG